MRGQKYISQAYEGAKRIDIGAGSKIVIMSDCHRGYGDWADSFEHNQASCFSALNYYNRQKYTYIELGDGDELWENRSFAVISTVHNNIFWLLSQFYRDGRLHMLYGNHDMVKKKQQTMLESYYDAEVHSKMPLFPGITVHECIVMRYMPGGGELVLMHGHQADFFNNRLWWLGRFLVRNVWRPLQMVGIKNPTSAAVAHSTKERVEKSMCRWSDGSGKILIAGHTHRTVFPRLGECRYFNDGSAVHPRCITAIEIEDGTITLVKWGQKTRGDGTLYIGRDVLAGPELISDYCGDTQTAKYV